MNAREDLESPTGKLIHIKDPMQFGGPVKFEQLIEKEVDTAKLADTSPSVLNIERLVLANTSPVNITNFDDAQEGQPLIVLGDGQSTIKNNSNIQTNSGADIATTNGKPYSFVYMLSKWRQV